MQYLLQGGNSLTLLIIQYVCCQVCKTYAIIRLSPQDCQTALMLASDSGHTEVVQLLLSSGAKVDVQNKVRHN